MRTIILLLLAVTILYSCESKSGQRSRVERVEKSRIDNSVVAPEKVVILDAIPKHEIVDGTFVYTYKVKRINKGVSDYCRDTGLYEKGDTILVNHLQFR